MDYTKHRKHKRAKGTAPVFCSGVMGRLCDISRGGLAFSVGNQFETFPLGSVHELKLKIPRTEEQPEKIDLVVSGTVRNLHEDDEKKRLIIGIVFNELPQQIQDAVNRVILFFARTFAPLQQIEDSLNFKEIEEPLELSVAEIKAIFRWALSNFESLPDHLKQEIHDFSKSIHDRFDIL